MDTLNFAFILSLVIGEYTLRFCKLEKSLHKTHKTQTNLLDVAIYPALFFENMIMIVRITKFDRLFIATRHHNF